MLLSLTYHWLKDVLHDLHELLVNLDGQVTQDLPVLCQVEVREAVFILSGGVVLHKGLW